MANTFITLAVPVTSGVGAAADVSGAGTKTVLIEGVPPGIGQFAGQLIIEGSQDAGASFVPLASIQIPVDPPKIVIPEAIQLIRVRRDNVSIGTPAPVVTVGSPDVAGNLFASFVVTAGDGTGAAVDTSAHPTEHTVLVSGSYRGSVVVEASQEAVGENFDPVAEIDSQGVDRVSFSGAYSRLRIRREASGLDPGLPIVTLGSTSGGVGGGGDAEDISEELTNLAGFLIPRGTIVRAFTADNTFTTPVTADPQSANILESLRGVLGVTADDIPAAASGRVIFKGKAVVRLEPGLVGVTSQRTLWVSNDAAQSGKATTLRPAIQFPVGSIKDASSYGVDETVIADIDTPVEIATGPDMHGYRNLPTANGGLFDRTYLAGRVLSSSPSSAVKPFSVADFDRAWLVPVVFPVGGTITNLRQFVRATNAGGLLLDVAIYSNRRRDVYPDKRLFLGAFGTGGVGPVLSTPSPVGKIIAPGLYWFAVRWGAAGRVLVTFDAVAIDDMFAYLGTPVPIGATPLPWGVALTRLGALSDPFPAGATIVQNDGVETIVPTTYFDFATE